MIIKSPVWYDTSHWKLIPDFKAIYPKPMGMITKATEGINYIDSTFVRYMIGMREAGYWRGCFHFNRKLYKGIDQARHFLSVVDGYVDDNTILVLDVEEGGEKVSELWSWFETVRAKYPNNRLMLYSRKNIMEAWIMTESEKLYFRKIPVWVAGYPANPDVYNSVPSFYIPDPLRFGPVWLWQYTDSGHIDGISGDVDCNYISPVFELILGTTTQPHTGETMSQWYKVNTAGLNVRNGPGASYERTGGLVQDDQIETIFAQTGGWIHIVRALRNGAPLSLVDPAWCSGAYCVPIPPPVVTPPPAVVKVPFTLTQTVNIEGMKPYTFTHSGELEKA